MNGRASPIWNVLEAIDANQVFTLSLDTRVSGTTFVVCNSCELQDSGTGDQLNAYRYPGSDSAANVSPSLDALEYVGLFAVVESPTVLRCMLRRTASTVEWSRSDIDYLPSRFGLRAYYALGHLTLAGFSISGLATYIQVPELSVCFDWASARYRRSRSITSSWLTRCSSYPSKCSLQALASRSESATIRVM